MSLLLFFIDGIGIAGKDMKDNGLDGLFENVMEPYKLTDLRQGETLMFDNGGGTAADAVLGVSGIPQSATGQATIFTGVNTQKLLGYHLTAFPNSRLVKLIKRRSLMKQLKKDGVSVTSANMYSEGFFNSRTKGHRNMFPVSTLTIMVSGVPFRMYDDYLKDKAVFADITNELIRQRGWDIEIITPEKAAENMMNILSGHQFAFFEYFMTDLFGHKKDRPAIKKEISKLNRFTERLIEEKKHDILILSDHGNAEDLSSGDHTINPVPVLFLSADREKTNTFLHKLSGLDQVFQRVRTYFY